MYLHLFSVQCSSVQSLSRVRLFVTPWVAARQASLSITNSRRSLKLTCIKSVMPSSHLIFCRPLFLLPPIPPSIRVFSNESTLCMRWPKYWSFSFSIIPSKEHPLILVVFNFSQILALSLAQLLSKLPLSISYFWQHTVFKELYQQKYCQFRLKGTETVKKDEKKFLHS